MAFGGGGYFIIDVDPAGVQQLEAGFDFGASLAMDFGVASGEVHVLGGFIYAMKDGNASLDGFLRIGGNVQALGIVSVSIELALDLHYEFSSGKCVGRATLTVEVEITFFSVSVEITCERKFAGSSGDPTFAEIMPPPAWHVYCEAFARRMSTQRLTWTALPWGRTDDGRPRLSAYLTPRLEEATTGSPTLATDFPDFVDWPATVNAARFERRCCRTVTGSLRSV